MATVTSLTEAKIQELMAGWEAVGLSQEEINALVIHLRNRVETQDATFLELENVTLPQLRADLAAGSIQVSELNDTKLPNLQMAQDALQADLADLNTVVLPVLRADLDSGIENAMLRPQTFFSDTPPEGDVERPLQVGDVWHDTSDGNRQHRWDGTNWVTFEVDIADFSLTVKKFMTSTHLIY